MDYGRIFPFEGTSPSANSNQTVPLLSYIVPCMEVEVELFVLINILYTVYYLV